MLIWTYFDKLLGLAYATTAYHALINGGSSAEGCPKYTTSELLKGFYDGIAGNVVVDWLSMIGLRSSVQHCCQAWG